MSQNYEKLYKDLKVECDQIKSDNDEICKEYELTIQMLTESVNNFKKEKESFVSRISQMEIEIKKYEKEKETLLNRNKDKILDIQNLNKENEKLKEEMKKISEEKHLNQAKIISLENGNDYFQKEIRQNEALIEDLKSQLESTLEENITLQTEFELYKQQNEEALIRKDQEIKDFQNDINNKEKIIQRLNDKRASIRELKQKFQLPNEFIKQYQRKLTTSTAGIYEDIKKKDIINNKNEDNINFFRKETVNIENLITPINNSTTKYPSKFMEIYRKSLRGGNNPINKITQKNESIKNSIDLMKNVKIDDDLLVSKKSNNIFSKVNTLKDDTLIENENEDKNEKEEEEEEESTASDKKCFEDLVICDEKDFNIIPIKKLMSENKKIKDKKLADNLKSMLLRIQKRKEALINHQIANYKKLEQLGYKLR